MKLFFYLILFSTLGCAKSSGTQVLYGYYEDGSSYAVAKMTLNANANFDLQQAIISKPGSSPSDIKSICGVYSGISNGYLVETENNHVISLGSSVFFYPYPNYPTVQFTEDNANKAFIENALAGSSCN